MTIRKPDLPTPDQVVDYAFTLTGPERCPRMISKIGRFAGWNPLLLHRADVEVIRRLRLDSSRGSLNWDDRQRYNGVQNAILRAYDSSIAGPRRHHGQ